MFKNAILIILLYLILSISDICYADKRNTHNNIINYANTIFFQDIRSRQISIYTCIFVGVEYSNGHDTIVNLIKSLRVLLNDNEYIIIDPRWVDCILSSQTVYLLQRSSGIQIVIEKPTIMYSTVVQNDVDVNAVATEIIGFLFGSAA